MPRFHSSPKNASLHRLFPSQKPKTRDDADRALLNALSAVDIYATDLFMARLSGHCATDANNMHRKKGPIVCPDFPVGKMHLLNGIEGKVDNHPPLAYLLEAAIMYRTRPASTFVPGPRGPGCYMLSRQMNVASPHIQLAINGVWPRHPPCEFRVAFGHCRKSRAILLATPQDL